MDDANYLGHTVKAEKLQQYMNIVDATGSKVLTREDEENNGIPSWRPSLPEKKMET